jgi:hypothetical protein
VSLAWPSVDVSLGAQIAGTIAADLGDSSNRDRVQTHDSPTIGNLSRWTEGFEAGVVGGSAEGAQRANRDPWDEVLRLQSGQKVQIRLEAERRNVTGTFIAADSAGITLLSNQDRVTLSRGDVQRVRAVTKGRERFLLLGGVTMLAGTSIMLAQSLSDARAVSGGRSPNQGGLGRNVLPIAVIGAGGVLGAFAIYRHVYERRQP